eukprot:14758478-Ditylum_brightwellii.AAC.1
MYSPSANKPPERPRKKIMIQLINDLTMAQAPTYQGNQDSTSIGTMSNYNARGTTTTVSEDTVKEMNKNLKHN